MKNIFKGSLKGYVCEDCIEFISGVEILIYLPYRKETRTADVVTNAKEVFHFVSEDEAKQRQELLIGKAKTDAKGNFEFAIDERHLSSDIDIDFICGTVPPKFPKPKRDEIPQFHLTTLSMRTELEKQNQDQNYRWEYAIAYKWWCYIRGHYFDAWVICGHLMNCKTGKPIANAKVTAMDADFLTDDNLGSDTTDANGHFRIDYTSVDFKKTFLSPWINVETDPNFLSFQSGPDVYFKAELGGTTLINETKASARKNVGYCLCVNLCSEIAVIGSGETIPSAWTGIGLAFSSSYGLSSNDFDADGFAGSGKHVLFSTIRLTGQASLKSVSGNPVEYRFRVSNTTAPNNTASLPAANFTKIVGVTPGLFVPSVVSKLTKKVFSFILNDLSVVSHQSDFDAEGWFDVNHAIERTLIGVGLTPADLALYNVIEEDTLISMDTSKLTTAVGITPDSINPGQNIPAGSKTPLEKFAIRFEIREVIDKPSNSFGVIGGDGKTLNSVVMNNTPIYRQLSIKELEESTLCSPVNGTLHAKYTLYHPYLSSCKLNIRKNSEITERDILDGIINTAPAVDERTSSSSQLNNPPSLTRCTYIVKLYSSTRKHNGDDGDSDGGTPLEQLFFYDV